MIPTLQMKKLSLSKLKELARVLESVSQPWLLWDDVCGRMRFPSFILHCFLLFFFLFPISLLHGREYLLTQRKAIEIPLAKSHIKVPQYVVGTVPDV